MAKSSPTRSLKPRNLSGFAKPAAKTAPPPPRPSPAEQEIREEVTPAAAQPDAITSGDRGRAGNASPSSKEPQTAKPPAKRPATTGKRRGKNASDAGLPTLVFKVSESLRTRLRDYSYQSDTPFRDVVLDAIETHLDELPNLLAARENATAPAVTRGPVFTRRVTTRSAGPQQLHQVTIRGVLQSQLDELDQLAQDLGAASRTALITTALDAYLPGSGK